MSPVLLRELQRRRALLKAGGSAGLLGLLAAAGFLPAREALAQQQPWNAPAFSTKSVADTVRALGAAAPAANKAIEIKAADIAENGLLVPVEVTSNIPNTESIAILVEKNPHTLSAVFNIPEDGRKQRRVRAGQGRGPQLLCAQGNPRHPRWLWLICGG
jgi:sulfur-oxidizing protein SoxY